MVRRSGSRFTPVLAGLVFLAGCGGPQGGSVTPAPSTSLGGQAHSVRPEVIQNGTKPINWTQFADPASGFGNTYAIAVGSDNDIWLGNNQGGLMHVSMSGSTTLFPLTYVYSGTTSTNYVTGYGMAVGKDKNFYMTGSDYDYNHSKYVVGVANTSGRLTVHDIPSGDYGSNGALTLGPDGDVWFTETSHIAKITTGGTITEYKYTSGTTNNYYGGVTTGPDGNIWFTDYYNNIIGKIVPSTGKQTEYNLTTAGVSCNPLSIAPGSDGNLYFQCTYAYLGQITTAGTATRFYNAFGMGNNTSSSLVKGPDGNPWFTDANGEYIGEYDPTLNAFTNYAPPYTGGTVYNLILGPDGNFWSASTDNKVDVYILKRLGVSPNALTFATTGGTSKLTVSESGTTSWTADASSPGVCSITQGTPADSFTVKANGLGATNITVKDAIGNSFVVRCTVH